MTLFPSQLDCPTAEIVPGEPLRCRLKIYNPSDAVNEFTVVGEDDAAGWVSTDPASLALLPHTDGEMLVNVVVPTDAPLEAGRHTLHIRIRSALDEFEDKIEGLILVVAASTGWELDVAPVTEEVAAKARTAASFDVRVRNTGNHPLEVRLSASPSSPDLTATLTDAVVAVPASQTRSSTLEVAAPAHTGPDDVHNHVDVHAQVEGAPARSRRVAYIQRAGRPGPRLRRVVLVSVAVVALLAAAIGGRIWWDGQVLLQRDDTGQEVARWQTMLNAFGAGLAVDGVFGRRTEAATRGFQEHVDLPVTGQVERRTWRAMERLLSAAHPDQGPAADRSLSGIPHDRGSPRSRHRAGRTSATPGSGTASWALPVRSLSQRPSPSALLHSR
jgi:hypothetical protein